MAKDDRTPRSPTLIETAVATLETTDPSLTGAIGGYDNEGAIDTQFVTEAVASESPKSRIKRTAITHEQRKALREWFFSQDPRPSQAASIVWFHNEYGRVISQAAISHSLHDRYKHLDLASEAPSSSYRQRLAQWPGLEAILFDYLQIRERQQGKDAFPSLVSGETLATAARTIWHQMPLYGGQGQSVPTFSHGWLARFKQRYKMYKQYGDATTVDLKALQNMSNSYKEDDIYNMDETSLFWKRTPAAQCLPVERSKITIVACTSASGKDRLPLWAIGRSKDIRSLDDINLKALGVRWRSNDNSWMTGSITEEWLHAFYEHVGDRNVLLVLDNFSAHIQGLAEAPPPTNIRVQFVPGNSSTIIQPLDKGLLEQFKVYYRLRWLAFMVDCYAKDEDPRKMVNVRYALKWASRAWTHDLSSETIRGFFYESAILSPQLANLKDIGAKRSLANLPSPPPFSGMDLLSSMYNQLWQLHRIPEMLPLESFVGLGTEETIGITDLGGANNDPLQAVINYHLGLANEANDVAEEDEVVIMDELVPQAGEALGHLLALMRFMERDPTSTRKQMMALEEVEMYLRAKLGV
jgi:hypothetical protein